MNKLMISLCCLPLLAANIASACTGLGPKQCASASVENSFLYIYTYDDGYVDSCITLAPGVSGYYDCDEAPWPDKGGCVQTATRVNRWTGAVVHGSRVTPVDVYAPVDDGCTGSSS